MIFLFSENYFPNFVDWLYIVSLSLLIRETKTFSEKKLTRSSLEPRIFMFKIRFFKPWSTQRHRETRSQRTDEANRETSHFMQPKRYHKLLARSTSARLVINFILCRQAEILWHCQKIELEVEWTLKLENFKLERVSSDWIVETVECLWKECTKTYR